MQSATQPIPYGGSNPATYLTTEELASRIKYNARTIRDCLKDSVLIEGKHYFRPFGGRKILYIWEVIERDMVRLSGPRLTVVPAAKGGALHG